MLTLYNYSNKLVVSVAVANLGKNLHWAMLPGLSPKSRPNNGKEVVGKVPRCKIK